MPRDLPEAEQTRRTRRTPADSPDADYGATRAKLNEKA
jgi:hypothetical protein